MEEEKRKKLDDFLIEIKKFKLNIEIGIENATSIEDKFIEIKNSMQKLLEIDKNSTEYKSFHNWYQGDIDLHYSMIPAPGSKAPSESKKINSLQEILEKLLNFSFLKEMSFSKEDAFGALNYLRKIIKNANEKVIIIDSYLDDIVFDLLDGVDDKVDIYFLTHGKGNAGDVFKRMYSAYIKNKSNAFAKINNSSHDRYLIIDDIKFFHLGASLNTIGKSDFMINEIETNLEKDRKLNDFKDWWKKGKDMH